MNKNALRVLQQMMGDEGAVFMRDLPINHSSKRKPHERYEIPWRKYVDQATFSELEKTGCIKLHIGGYDFQQWRMTEVGKQALRDARMETKPGTLSDDDVGWLTGTGRYAQ